VIALAEASGAAGMPAQARQTEALVEAERRLYAANGVNTDVELAVYAADHDGDVAGAVERMRALAARQPSVVTHDALAWALYADGRPREALRYANLALRLGGDDPMFRFHRGAIEARLGMDAAARADLTAALAQNPGFSVLHAPEARRLLERLS
jgi:Flp pilus assembly protein TadD